MDKHKPTQILPEEYSEIAKFDLDDHPGLAMILNLVGIGVLFGVAWLLMESLVLLRPEYLATENILIITGMREFWRNVLILVVSLGLMIILNEGGRWLMYWAITHQRPKIGFKGFYTYAAAPEWYLPKWAYLLIRLAPTTGITLFGLAVVPLVPLNLIPGVLLLVSLNLASATSDLYIVYWLSRVPKDILIRDYGDGVRVYHNDHQPLEVSVQP